MSEFNQEARSDFDHAFFKGFWRRLAAWLTGQRHSELLPFDEVRERLPMTGQRYAGLRQVPLNQIVGSVGRYRDFDRAFLPIQQRTRTRWENIDKAHLREVSLPPVELYKIDEVYFVKDGNHRVSVARERGQEFIDAVVIEIDVPVPLTPDLQMGDLARKEAYAGFLNRTELNRIHPEADIETASKAEYAQLLEHIDGHRWFMSKQRGRELSYAEAVASWYENVYLPIIEIIRENEILTEFPGVKEADLYLWLVKYQWYLHQAYREDNLEVTGDLLQAKEEAARMAGAQAPARIRRLIGLVKRSPWMEELLLRQERSAFFEKTQLAAARPGTEIEATTPGQYERLLDHISRHRWFLGIAQGREIPYQQAAASWLDTVYRPFTELIRETDLLSRFPEQKEVDLYLWFMERQAELKETYGDGVTMEDTLEQVVQAQREEEDDGGDLVNPLPTTFQG